MGGPVLAVFLNPVVVLLPTRPIAKPMSADASSATATRMAVKRVNLIFMMLLALLARHGSGGGPAIA